MWPFAKKKDEEAERIQPAPAEPARGTVHSNGAHPEMDADIDAPDPIHDAVSGASGPFDADSVNIEDFDFSDFSQGILNLGSVQIPLPLGSEVQVEMGATGPRMLHIVTQYGRITPVAFAAPRGGGQWRESTKKIAEDMRAEDYHVRVEQGPWGREVVGQSKNDVTVRLVGVDGPRWMLRMTLVAPTPLAENMKTLGREVTARTFVSRGDQPMMAGTSLPVALPDVLANHVMEAMEQRAQQAQQAQQAAEQPQPEQPQEQNSEQFRERLKGAQGATDKAPGSLTPQRPESPTPPRGPAASAFQQMKAEPR